VGKRQNRPEMSKNEKTSSYRKAQMITRLLVQSNLGSSYRCTKFGRAHVTRRVAIVTLFLSRTVSATSVGHVTAYEFQ